MKTSLARANKLAQRASQTVARARQKTKRHELVAVEKAGLAIGAAVIAGVESKMPVTIASVPTKVWLAAAGYLAAMFTKGYASQALSGAADAVSAVYIYKVTVQAKSGTAKPFIAGDEIGYVETETD